MTGMLVEAANWKCDWDVYKWDKEMTDWVRERLALEEAILRDPKKADFDRFGVRPYEHNHVPGNLLLTAGLSRITALIIGAGGQAATNTATRIGTGDGTSTAGGGSVPAVVGDTDLAAVAGSTHRQFVVMDASFPTQVNGLMTFQATFTSALGNYAWNEFGIDVTAAATNGTTVNVPLLNHKTSIAQGTKTAGQSWAASAAVTLS